MKPIIEKVLGEANPEKISSRIQSIDWVLFFATIPIIAAGLITMNSFVSESYFFNKQLISILFALAVFFIFSRIDFRFLRRTRVVIILFGISVGSLALLFLLGITSRGAQSWFRIGLFAFQPADIAKLVLIIILAKYFSRRHIEIAHVRHIFVSGLYAFALFVLVLLQPDLGSAVILFLVWFGMVLVSGISKKHLFLVFMIGVVSFFGLWHYAFKPYQKERIKNFINPLADVRGSGYNAYQSTIAVGAGRVLGKGIGLGTQSRLQFLPEYQTDFVFAAFAEEWGFVGVIFLFLCFGVVIWRVLSNALHGATNFEILFGVGLAVLLMSHFIIHVGMNMGLLPVTGLPLPFMSYGGSHLLTEFAGLGILMGMRRYSRDVHKDSLENEFLGA
ncbi:MAG: FtsW/RodA/SpoVE family cell cycle protein [Candidatus Pacebacteria bacterium]|nr:FtsW/RodA/SpoVE family cell cycle protein [Candidatus Paceibacterota bacterium]MDD5357433.1 FtsW/RodA/SpoVE family cell cycle protein [Candidatus Paceibacterota bacterium]